MYYDLNELSNKITEIATRIIEIAAQRTTNGTWSVNHDDIDTHISYEDFLQYLPFLDSELAGRPEILACSIEDETFDLSLNPKYCPKYEWQAGDETKFRTSQEMWEKNRIILPVSKPLSMSRMAEIGQNAIYDTLQNGDMAQEILTEELGLSIAELEQLNLCGPEQEEAPAPRREGPAHPICFYFYDDKMDHPSRHETFEDAIQVFESSDSTDKQISFLSSDEQGRGHGALLLTTDHSGKPDFCHLSKKVMEENPHVALAHAKSVLYCHPESPNAQQALADAEKAVAAT